MPPSARALVFGQGWMYWKLSLRIPQCGRDTCLSFKGGSLPPRHLSNGVSFWGTFPTTCLFGPPTFGNSFGCFLILKFFSYHCPFYTLHLATPAIVLPSPYHLLPSAILAFCITATPVVVHLPGNPAVCTSSVLGWTFVSGNSVSLVLGKPLTPRIGFFTFNGALNCYCDCLWLLWAQ